VWTEDQGAASRASGLISLGLGGRLREPERRELERCTSVSSIKFRVPEAIWVSQVETREFPEPEGI